LSLFVVIKGVETEKSGHRCPGLLFTQSTTTVT
jgi:hypothetical protein